MALRPSLAQLPGRTAGAGPRDHPPGPVGVPLAEPDKEEGSGANLPQDPKVSK